MKIKPNFIFGVVLVAGIWILSSKPALAGVLSNLTTSNFRNGGVTLVKANYDYGPTIMDDGGILKMWWCAGSPDLAGGDAIYYTQFVNGVGWQTPRRVFTARVGTSEWDNLHACDPSVVKVGEIYYLYYTGTDVANEPDYGRIGLASSPDGITWTRLNNGQPIVYPYKKPGDAGYSALPSKYGAGQQSVVFANGYYYMIYTDTSARDSNPYNGAGQYVLRSTSPLFANPEELVREGEFASRNVTNWGTYKLLEANSVDWMYSPKMNGFIIAISWWPGKITLLVEQGNLKKYHHGEEPENTRISLAPLNWVEGPGLITTAEKHERVSSNSSVVPVDLFYPMGQSLAGITPSSPEWIARVQGWELAHAGIDITIPPPADTTPPVIVSSSPSGTLAAGITTTTLQVTTNENATCKYGTVLNVPYASMPNTFSATGGTTHTATLTGLAPNSSFVYIIRCQDSSGNANQSDYYRNFATSALPDTVVPSATVTSPAADAIISGTSVTFSAAASDNVGVVGVQFYIGNTLLGDDTTAPYSISLNTTQFSDGVHGIAAIARDAAGNQNPPNTIFITIMNTVAAPSFSPNGAVFTASQQVTLTGPSGTTIRYTTDGSEPTASSLLYSSPVTLTQTTTVKAKAFSGSLGSSTTATATFTKQVVAPPSNPPYVQLDGPSSNSTVSGLVTIYGWALDHATAAEGAINRVEVFIDGIKAANATYGTSRPDVCGVYPGRTGCPYVGYTYAWDTSQVTNGSHTIRVQVFDNDSIPKSMHVDRTVTVSNVVIPAAPIISSFAAIPSTLNQGQSSTLSWSVTGATSLSITPGNLSTGSESVLVSPTQTTTYTLTAANASGSVTRTVTVTVDPPVVIDPPSEIAKKPYVLKINASSLEGTAALSVYPVVTIQVIHPVTGILLSTQSLAASSDGEYVINFQETDPEMVNVRVMVPGYLSKIINRISTTNGASAVPLVVPQLLAGDFNNDGIVNSLDYSLLNREWNQVSTNHDINRDGIINSMEYAVMSKNWGRRGE